MIFLLLLFKAVMRKAKRLGLIQQIQGNPNGRSLLRQYYALALLPAHLIPMGLRHLQVHFLFIFNILKQRERWHKLFQTSFLH